MQESCFSFLEEDYPEFYSECIQIENDFINLKLEKAFKSCLELSDEIIKIVLENENLEKYNNLSRFERLKQLGKYGILRFENQKPFDSIDRINNNLNQNLNMISAHKCHKFLFEIMSWFYMKYNFENQNKDFKYSFPDETSEEEIQEDTEDSDKKYKGSYLLKILKNLEVGSIESVENENFSELKRYLHVSRSIQKEFIEKAKQIYEKDSSHLIMICGSVGDGKSHLLAYLNDEHPDIYKAFTVKEDGTASYDYDKNPVQTLVDMLSDFNDENIFDESNKTKFILGINLGTLNNFLESEYADKFKKFSDIIEDSKIFDVNHFSNKLFYEGEKVTIFSFSDYNLFELSPNPELNFAKSDYLSELFKKITNKDLDNPFYDAYYADKKTLENNNYLEDINLYPIIYNYELFSNEEVQRIIIDYIIKISIKHKIIIPTRDILDLIYNIIVPPKLLDFTKSNFNDYKHQLLPNLLFNSPQRSDLLKLFNEFDPIISHGYVLDDFIIKLNINQELSNVLGDFIDLNKVDVLENCIQDIKTLKLNLRDEDKEEITSTLIRFALFFAKNNLKESFKDKNYLNYLKYLYEYNIQEPREYRSLFDEVEKAIFKRNNSESGFLCIDSLENFKILKPLDLNAKPIKWIKEDELSLNKDDFGNKFKKEITIKFSINDIKESNPLIIDYPLYDYIVKLNEGYKPNRLDNEDLVVFDEFINSLRLVKTENNKISVKKIHSESKYTFKYDDGFEQYTFGRD